MSAQPLALPPPAIHTWPSRALRSVGHVVLLVALIVAVTVALGILTLKIVGWQGLTVRTGSMQPGIVPGQVVLISSQQASQIRAGQIVTFRAPRARGTLTHRVVRAAPVAGGLIQVTTRGDANVNTETWRIAATGDVGRHRATLPALAGLTAPVVAGPARPAFAIGAALLAGGLALAWIWMPGGPVAKRRDSSA